MQKLRPALCTPWRGLAPAQVLEGEQVPSVSVEQTRGAVQCPKCGPGCSQAACSGSRNSMGCRMYVTPKFPAGQSPSALDNAAFQDFL